MKRQISRQTSLTVKIRILAFLALLGGAFFSHVLWLSAPAAAQVQTGQSQSAKLQSIFQRGESLEIERKWGEALAHYEKALREIPANPLLRERHDWAKIHYDLGRRYHDVSFQQSTVSLDERQALDLYSEVLLKIDSHYFQGADWRQLASRGAKSLDMALNKDFFIERYLRGVAPERIDAARVQLRELAQRQTIQTRQHAVAAARSAAELLSRELGLRPSVTVIEYACAAAAGLDTYSSYLTEDQLRDVYAQIDGNFVGLGIELKADDGVLLIVSVISGSPADRAGLQANDRILSVDGHSTEQLDTDEAARLLQGPEKSVARLMIATGEGPPRAVSIRREHVDVPSVEDVEIVDPAHSVGYFRLVGFQRSTGRDVDAALWKLYHAGMKSLIIDVRGNPGGLLTAAVDVADKFIAQGTIVSTRGRNKIEDFDYTARKISTWKVPLVVLIDENSASASEIFAAAIRGHRAGTVVGERSYGKGCVQGIFPLARAGAGIRLTTAKFYGPGGQPISQVGVQPDVTVHVAAKPEADSTAIYPPNTVDDAVLKAGIQTAYRMVAQR